MAKRMVVSMKMTAELISLLVGVIIGSSVAAEYKSKKHHSLEFKRGYEYGLKEGLDQQCNVTIIEDDGTMRIYSQKEEV